jgi:hypothetical protein
MRQHISIALAAGFVAAAASGAPAVTTTFDNGAEGWSVSGRTNISLENGNPGANLDNEVLEVFVAEIRNETNPAFIGDLSRYGEIFVSVDVKINSIRQSLNPGIEETRELGLNLVDFPDEPGGAIASVYLPLTTLDATVNDEWTTYTATILDPTSEILPPGWIGTGAEDPDTFEPILPEGRTFANVIANVDKFEFTTFTPGFFFGFTDFDIQVDNPTIRTVPAPGAAGVLAATALVAGRRRR